MTSTELTHLEFQVDHLMRLIETLQLENATLRQKMAVLSQERARWEHKTHRAAKQVKQIIKHMKEGIA